VRLGKRHVRSVGAVVLRFSGGVARGIGCRTLGELLGGAGGGVFEGGVELAVFGVVGEVEGFEEGFGEIVGLLADLLAAFGGEEELGEVAESGGAAGGDAVGGEGAEDAGHGAMNVVFGGRILGEEADFLQEVFVVLDGSAAFEQAGVGAAVAVEGRDGGHAAGASIGEFMLAKIVG
jgi:hypothetical protein